MNKQLKIMLFAILIAFVFVIGLKVGENNTIKHQHITKTERGYLVDFDGEIYEYTED